MLIPSAIFVKFIFVFLNGQRRAFSRPWFSFSLLCFRDFGSIHQNVYVKRFALVQRFRFYKKMRSKNRKKETNTQLRSAFLLGVATTVTDSRPLDLGFDFRSKMFKQSVSIGSLSAYVFRRNTIERKERFGYIRYLVKKFKPKENIG